MKLRGSDGFTFVEAITVAVIAAVLAAVAIPIYTGYVENQKKETLKNLAKSASLAANAYWRRNNADPPNAAALNLFLPGTDYVLSINASQGYVVITQGSLKDSASYR